LNRAGQGREAAAHFARALALDPFNAQAARSLSELWQRAGDGEKSNRLAEERRLLATAASPFVPVEPWFRETGKRSRRQRIPITMIVRNEEGHLPACLASVVDLVDEVIVADTGSTDHTRDIAVRFGARVVEFPWVDDFAAARNAALQQATGDWVWWLDA